MFKGMILQHSFPELLVPSPNLSDTMSVDFLSEHRKYRFLSASLTWENLELHMVEGSQKKQEKLALTFAHSRLPGVVPLEACLYFCFSYKWELFWSTSISVFMVQPYGSYLTQVLWCCESLFLQPCFNIASLCPLKMWTATHYIHSQIHFYFINPLLEPWALMSGC